MFIESDWNEEIRAKIAELKDLEVGSDEYSKAVNSISKMMETSLEYNRFAQEQSETHIKRRLDDKRLENEANALKDARRDNTVKNVLTLLSVAVPATLFAWATIGSWEFEKDYTNTNSPGKRALDKILSMKLN